MNSIDNEKGNFYCTKCDVSWSDDYKPQQRPRRSCPKCQKSCDLDKRKVGNSGSPTTQEKGSSSPKNPE